VRALPARVVDEGAVVTGGGVSLAIDLTLHLLARLCGAAVATETARIIEYTAAWRATGAAFETLAPATTTT
jgi:transcriptional regulator GlxA family with amidase domain